jgi:hypothetical protein
MGRDFRIVFTVFKKERVVDIEFVADRKDAYRWLRPRGSYRKRKGRRLNLTVA